mgnify:CR=1 FL=1
MKYMITGATGFIGGALARKLLERGHELNALVRTPGKAEWLSEGGVNIFKGDITDKETLYEPMKGVDGVFHVAAWYKVGARDKSKAESINVGGTENVLEVMKELSISKGVYTSTLAVFSDTEGRVVSEDYRYDGEHISEYDRTKWKAHYEVALPMMDDGLPLVIVQPGVVYGPGDENLSGKMIDRYLKRELPMLPKVTAWCWAHVDDIAQGHILAMEKGRTGESYIISGEKHSIEEAMETAGEIMGIKPPGIRASPWMLKLSSRLMVPVNSIFDLPSFYRPETLRVSAGVTYLGSNEKARKELGYSPRTLEEGFREFLPRRMQELGIKGATIPG